MKRVRPRPLVASAIVQPPVRAAGGGRERAALVEAARESIARGSRSFAFASLLFDRETRERVHLLYAWCRRCDDIADGQEHGGALNVGGRPDGRAMAERVEAIRVLTRRALAGQPTADIAFDALGQVASEVGITADLCDDVIDGFALDAAGWQPATEADLMRYCFHVAGAVGVLMARVMGVPADAYDTLDRACDLGLAFQLNNIARDIGEDEAGGRRYLPADWLAEAGIAPEELFAPQHRDRLAAMAARLVAMAETHEAAARVGAGALAFRHRWAVLSAANIYGAIGRKVVAAGPAAWDRRIHTGALEKARHVAAALREAVSGVPMPAEAPRWSRGALMAMARMERPPAPLPMTPLRDEGVRPKVG